MCWVTASGQADTNDMKYRNPLNPAVGEGIAQAWLNNNSSVGKYLIRQDQFPKARLNCQIKYQILHFIQGHEYFLQHKFLLTPLATL